MARNSDQIRQQIEELKAELKRAQAEERRQYARWTDEVTAAIGELVLGFYGSKWEAIDIPALLRELDGGHPVTFKMRTALDPKDARDEFLALVKARKGGRKANAEKPKEASVTSESGE